MSRIFRAYESLLRRYPITSQTLQTSIIISAGDGIAQTVVENRTLKDYDFKRTFQFFCVGIFYLGPTLTVWYRTLDRFIGTGGKYYGFKKMAADQIFFAPICLAGFLTTANTFQGRSLEELKSTFKNIYPEILIANYKVWPAVQVINFTFVPLHFQVLYVQMISLIWNTYVCYMTKAPII